jgi:alkanesulfonate monooxygenase SsuD/methylene tetrahydromethanopterin reductase-like flavin-dependent oxidoreductase (luciferase family)
MEYEVLNENFKNRGRRLEEQIEVLRRLWTEDYVTFEGEWHHLDRIGLNPNSVRRPIPIWMGSFRGAVVEKVLQRTARMADGWLPQFPADDEFRDVASRFWGYVDEAGRDRASIGMDCPVNIKKDDDPDRWMREIDAFRALGATCIRVHTSGGGFSSPGEHLDAALRFKQHVDAR